MFSQVFLAVTAMQLETVCPKRIAYMACHFSAGGAGLSNIPRSLPKDSILLLDDSMPVQGHDPKAVAAQLNELVDRFSLQAVLLDFQRPPTQASQEMVSAILHNCRCKAAVTPAYAKVGFGVFLPPPPPNKSLAEHLMPWKKYGVFLELALEDLEITVTKAGSRFSYVSAATPLPLADARLHCHYGVTVFPGKAVFTLSRSREDLAALARQAEALGVIATVGLYQELQQKTEEYR